MQVELCQLMRHRPSNSREKNAFCCELVSAGQQPLIGGDVVWRVHLDSYLCTDRTTKCDGLLALNPVNDLRALLALGQHTASVENVEVLRQIGLGGVNLLEHLTHRLLFVAQRTQDAQAHRR